MKSVSLCPSVQTVFRNLLLFALYRGRKMLAHSLDRVHLLLFRQVDFFNLLPIGRQEQP